MEKKFFGTHYDIFINEKNYSIYTGFSDNSIEIELSSGETRDIIEILNENQVEISLASPLAKRIAKKFKEEREAEICEEFDEYDPLILFGD